MTNPRRPTTCPACGGNNFNWARRCDHCGASLSGSLDDATTSSAASPENVADIDPPKIPTMPPFNKRAALAGLAAAFEVSPFGLSEIHDDGTIRRIVWGAGVTLRNHASRRRLELFVTSADSCIDIPYSVVGFSRLVGLIVAKGGFVVDGPEAV